VISAAARSPARLPLSRMEIRCQARKTSPSGIKRPPRRTPILAGWIPASMHWKTRLQVRRLSHRQASQLPRRCDIPAAWATAHAVFYGALSLDRCTAVSSRRGTAPGRNRVLRRRGCPRASRCRRPRSRLRDRQRQASSLSLSRSLLGGAPPNRCESYDVLTNAQEDRASTPMSVSDGVLLKAGQSGNN
jgi:hypothetical protein